MWEWRRKLLWSGCQSVPRIQGKGLFLGIESKRRRKTHTTYALLDSLKCTLYQHARLNLRGSINTIFGKISLSEGASAPQTPPDLAPPAPTGAGRPSADPPQMGGRWPSAAAPPFWGPLLAPEAPGPGCLWGGSPPRKASPPELCYLAVLVAGCNTQNM